MPNNQEAIVTLYSALWVFFFFSILLKMWQPKFLASVVNTFPWQQQWPNKDKVIILYFVQRVRSSEKANYNVTDVETWRVNGMRNPSEMATVRTSNEIHAKIHLASVCWLHTHDSHRRHLSCIVADVECHSTANVKCRSSRKSHHALHLY